jgi:hypothetical protein
MSIQYEQVCSIKGFEQQANQVKYYSWIVMGGQAIQVTYYSYYSWILMGRRAIQAK